MSNNTVLLQSIGLPADSIETEKKYKPTESFSAIKIKIVFFLVILTQKSFTYLIITFCSCPVVSVKISSIYLFCQKQNSFNLSLFTSKCMNEKEKNNALEKKGRRRRNNEIPLQNNFREQKRQKNKNSRKEVEKKRGK